jgi:hypothetical protein
MLLSKAIEGFILDGLAGYNSPRTMHNNQSDQKNKWWVFQLTTYHE